MQECHERKHVMNGRDSRPTIDQVYTGSRKKVIREFQSECFDHEVIKRHAHLNARQPRWSGRDSNRSQRTIEAGRACAAGRHSHSA